jgi:hypothetical protein
VRRLLGAGGSADVFLYEQELPRRAVAVKVLLAGVDTSTREAFEREADLTAQVSHHPSIVTVHQAGVASDGRPYLVMEYCARPGLGQRYRSERFEVAEVLELGVRLASAVETAHRAGILHRDIKPGNVLTTDFGRPVLADFGIAATVDAGGPAVGMSIPWAAPELLAARPHGDARSDVYSLAATLFSALAGRSPFERPGGPNEAADLVGRIERGAPVPIARGDVPERLRTVLARAMARDPQLRHAHAVDLAHDLRAVEADLGLPLTPIEVDDSAAGAGPGRSGADAEADATRVRAVVEVAPGPVAPGPAASSAPRPWTADPVGAPVDLGAGPEATRMRPVVTVSPGAGSSAATPSAASSAGASVPGSLPTLPSAPTDRPSGPPVHEVHPGGGARSRTGRRVLAAAGSALVLVAVVVGVVLVAGRPDGGAAPGAGSEFPGPTEPVAGTVPAPVDLAGTRAEDGSVTFTWTNPTPEDGDSYLWGRRTVTGPPALELVEGTSVTVEAQPDEQVCVEVSIVRADRRASAVPAEGCVP